MKALFSFLLFVLFSLSFGQSTIEKDFKKLKKSSCEDYQNGSENDQTRCFLINIVTEDLNYLPSETKISAKPINTALEAYQFIRKSFGHPKNEFCCWTEYQEYFVFAFEWGLKKKVCVFYSIIYVKKGESEFRTFVPRT